ncbi:MAG TPA: hypothetical protein VMQ83_13230 [Gammaproteobacteria bacterium]|nr:hypothetical protein [Gammaproteobacteria bacterium]
MNRRSVLSSLAGVTAVVGLALACGGPAASPSPAGTSVDVTLQEWAVVPSAATAPAGQVTFVITNQGPDDIHEFVVMKTDLSVHELPVDANGVMDEAAGGMEVQSEVEDIPVGGSETLIVSLDAGNYALICNIYDEGEGEAHYTMGMRTAFSVQ